MGTDSWTLGIFGSILASFWIADVFYMARVKKALSLRVAAFQTFLWISLGVAFSLYIYYQKGSSATLDYLSAYLTEYALSVDNIFVILLILRYFAIQDIHQHKALLWGVLGAIVMRGIFIFLGAWLIRQFDWILYIFGGLLLYAGINILFAKEEGIDIQRSPILRFTSKYFPITTKEHEGRFFLSIRKRRHLTLMGLAVIMIEGTDLIFAIDSIPAAYGITQDPIIVFTSNIFAIMGLRALYFVLRGIVNRFWALKPAVALILVFVGLKMFLPIIDIHLSSLLSFSIILSGIAGGVAVSLIFPRHDTSQVDG